METQSLLSALNDARTNAIAQRRAAYAIYDGAYDGLTVTDAEAQKIAANALVAANAWHAVVQTVCDQIDAVMGVKTPVQ